MAPLLVQCGSDVEASEETTTTITFESRCEALALASEELGAAQADPSFMDNAIENPETWRVVWERQIQIFSSTRDLIEQDEQSVLDDLLNNLADIAESNPTEDQIPEPDPTIETARELVAELAIPCM